MSLARTAWVKLNHLRIGVGRFGSSMHKWGLACSAKCECGANEQTAELSFCFVADATFTSESNVMRPYPGKSIAEEQKMFNY